MLNPASTAYYSDPRSSVPWYPGLFKQYCRCTQFRPKSTVKIGGRRRCLILSMIVLIVQFFLFLFLTYTNLKLHFSLSISLKSLLDNVIQSRTFERNSIRRYIGSSKNVKVNHTHLFSDFWKFLDRKSFLVIPIDHTIVGLWLNEVLSCSKESGGG